MFGCRDESRLTPPGYSSPALKDRVSKAVSDESAYLPPEVALLISTSTAPIFALDRGTRHVVGIVARPAADRLSVLVIAVDERARRDGQIHDIPKVVFTQ